MARVRDYTGYREMSMEEKRRLVEAKRRYNGMRSFGSSWERYLERVEVVEMSSEHLRFARDMYEEWKSVIRGGKVYKVLRDEKERELVEGFDWSGLEKGDKERGAWLRDKEEDIKRYWEVKSGK
jgi:hypothetical protein